MVNLETDLAGIKLKNPVMVASGTYGYGKEYADYVDLDKLGAIITKSVSLRPREGNPPPRICETASGMLNSIGLQNEGIHKFLETAIPFLSKYKVPVIVNIASEEIADYAELAKILNGVSIVKGLEVNVSCPNVKNGMQFGVDPNLTAEVTKAVKKSAGGLPVIIKLSPNVTDITVIAKAAEAAGADALSLTNTVLGMSIDIKTRKPRLAMKMGGLSGPAIKPIALRMVYQVAHTVKIPVIGIGGIVTAEDAIEFFLAGAKAVQIGTGNFVDTQAPINAIEGISEYLAKNKMLSVKDLKMAA
jgi:dihydroorotate dehydrogenase (NAD+) catalytic subunit